MSSSIWVEEHGFLDKTDLKVKLPKKKGEIVYQAYWPRFIINTGYHDNGNYYYLQFIPNTDSLRVIVVFASEHYAKNFQNVYYFKMGEEYAKWKTFIFSDDFYAFYDAREKIKYVHNKYNI